MCNDFDTIHVKDLEGYLPVLQMHISIKLKHDVQLPSKLFFFIKITYDSTFIGVAKARL